MAGGTFVDQDGVEYHETVEVFACHDLTEKDAAELADALKAYWKAKNKSGDKSNPLHAKRNEAGHG